MGRKILTSTQEKFLALFGQDAALYGNFILSGGTALAGFYLQHRYSEDLNFFSAVEFDPQEIFPLLKKFLKPLHFQKIEYQQSFNRNLYFFTGKKETLKTEFTYFPFYSVVTPTVKGNLKIDSLKDIAVNKVFTIYQKPRMRDFIDLYEILRTKKWTLEPLLKLARIKFDTHIDPLQWGSRLLQVNSLQDYPRMIAPLNASKMKLFFMREAKKSGTKIF